MAIFATLDQKMAAFDALAPELRDLIDYGPFNPDSAFIVRDLQDRYGATLAAEIVRDQIHTEFPGWTPERGSPLATNWRIHGPSVWPLRRLASSKTRRKVNR